MEANCSPCLETLPRMSDPLDRQLSALEVQIHPFVVCEVDSKHRLRLPAMDTAIVHYVLRGSGFLCFPDERCVSISPHTLVFLPPETAHLLVIDPKAPHDVDAGSVCMPLGDGLIAFSAADQAADDRLVTACGTIQANLRTGTGLFGEMREPLIEHCLGNKVIEQAFEQLLDELSHPSFGTRAIAEVLVKQCLVLVLRAQLDRGEIGLLPLLTYQDRRLAPAVTAMLDNPAADHNLEALAKLSNMSRSLFAERFTTVFGQPPIEFLKKLRLRHAARLLSVSDMPVSLISGAVGYASRSYFSRAFSAEYGMDPRRYREESRAQSGQASTGALLRLAGARLLDSMSGSESSNQNGAEPE